MSTFNNLTGFVEPHYPQSFIEEITAKYVQGLRWNKSTDTYQRIGSIADIPNSQSAGNANLPIQSKMRRCTVNDDGTVNYYIDSQIPVNKENTTHISTGTLTSESANKLIDSSATFDTDGVEAGMAVMDVNFNYLGIVTAVDSATQLSMDLDRCNTGLNYIIGSAKFDGTDGQVMVEIPKFYHKEKHFIVHEWNISTIYLPGYQIHPAFVKDGEEVDYRYYSAFEGSLYDASNAAMCSSADVPTSIYAAGDKLCSVAGNWAKTNEQRTKYRAAAAERGTGWRQLDFWLHSAVQLLYLIEYADFNTQAMIGEGRTNLSGGDWVADSYIGRTGLSVADGNNTNSVSNGGTNFATDYMTYRGIENWYGNVWKMVDGIVVDGRWTGDHSAFPIYVSNNVAYFNDTDGNNMTHLCDASYIGTIAGYISDIEATAGFIPKSVSGGSATTYLTDYYWQYNESSSDYYRVFLFGDHAAYGLLAGGLAVWVANNWTYDNVNAGGRLCR